MYLPHTNHWSRLLGARFWFQVHWLSKCRLSIACSFAYCFTNYCLTHLIQKYISIKESQRLFVLINREGLKLQRKPQADYGTESFRFHIIFFASPIFYIFFLVILIPYYLCMSTASKCFCSRKPNQKKKRLENIQQTLQAQPKWLCHCVVGEGQHQRQQ